MFKLSKCLRRRNGGETMSIVEIVLSWFIVYLMGLASFMATIGVIKVTMAVFKK